MVCIYTLLYDYVQSGSVNIPDSCDLTCIFLLQAAKYNKQEGSTIREWILKSQGAAAAKDIGDRHFRKPFRQENFQQVNMGIMFDINLAKFQQNQKLRRWLLETDSKSYILHTMNSDAFWGLGQLEQDGKYHGLNWNGRILMAVRHILLKLVRFAAANRSQPLSNI